MNAQLDKMKLPVLLLCFSICFTVKLVNGDLSHDAYPNSQDYEKWFNSTSSIKLDLENLFPARKNTTELLYPHTTILNSQNSYAVVEDDNPEEESENKLPALSWTISGAENDRPGGDKINEDDNYQPRSVFNYENPYRNEMGTINEANMPPETIDNKPEKPGGLVTMFNTSHLVIPTRQPFVHISTRQLGDKEENRPFNFDLQPRDIKFSDVPPGEAYLSDLSYSSSSLGIGSAFVSAVQPKEFPLEFMVSAIEGKMTTYETIRKSVSAEPGVIAVVCVCAAMVIAMPIVGITVCACRLNNHCLGYDQKMDYSQTSCGNCHRRSVITSIALLALLLLSGIIITIVSNEFLGQAVSEANTSLKNNVKDVDTYLKNTKMQLRYLVTNSLEETVDAIYSDLDNVQTILGQPLQRDLASEAQIDPALDSLIVISKGLGSIAHKMRTLENLRIQAKRMSTEVESRLLSIRKDLDEFILNCSNEDKHLCLTLDTYGLDVMVDFDSISFSNELRLISAIESHNLTETVRIARYEFNNIPVYVDSMTRMAREDVKRAVQEIRSSLYQKVRGLDDMAYDLENQAKTLVEYVENLIFKVQKWEPIRYYTTIGIWISLLLTWLLLSIGATCGCCVHRDDIPPSRRSTVSHSAGQLIVGAAGIMIILSTFLWIIVIGIFIIGAHSHCLVCRPLYEDSTYSTLTKLLSTSVMGSNNESIFRSVLQRDQNDKSLGEVLRQCEKRQTAYQVFELKNFFDLESEIDYRSRINLRNALDNINVNLSHVNLLTPGTEGQLKIFLRAANIDITPYRRQLERSLVGKNMPIFTEQMENIAGRIQSLPTVSKLNKLITRTKNFITNSLYPLEKKKENLGYQIATLDMELMPLQRQINQSSSHLNNIQKFVHQRGAILAASKVRGYQERLISYTRQYTDHVKAAAIQSLAPCTPVWKVFDSARSLLCQGIIAPLNELWLSIGLCLILFIPLIGLGLSLSSYYVRVEGDDESFQLSETEIPEEPPVDKDQPPIWTTSPSPHHQTRLSNRDESLPPLPQSPRSPRTPSHIRQPSQRHRQSDHRFQNGHLRKSQMHQGAKQRHW